MEPVTTTSSKRLWVAYLISPAIAPAVAAAAIFFGGPYLIDPNDTGTPIGIIALPIFLMTAGMVVSYLMWLAIGMPIAIYLERRSILNGYTIYGAAIAISLLSAVAFGMISLCLWLFGSIPAPPNLIELPKAGGYVFCAFAMFSLPSATMFWLVSCKLFSKGP